MRELLKKISIGYLVYALLATTLPFIRTKEVTEDYARNSQVEDYYGDETGDDRALILDNPLEAGLARLYIIENAKETLDISYYSIQDGETSNIFFGALFDAADRGVEVNVLLDGLSHGLRGSKRAIIYAIDNHPNMHLKFYEKVNWLKPWTINNRMHDKYIIADQELALIGGRNIGDKYFAPEWYEEEITNDRDVLIINTGELENSVLNEMTQYFEEIWNHKYTKDVQIMTKSIFRKMADKKRIDMQSKAEKAREEYQEQFAATPDLKEVALPTRKISFIRNPIERFSKEPWVWHELVQLLKVAEKSVFLQSPYIIPSKKMTNGILSIADLKAIETTFLTNSAASSPNILAFSGYQNYREQMVDLGIDILELQSKDSLHSKSLVIDEDIVAIGSFNIDPRSAFLSTESMVVIHSEDVVSQFGKNIFTYTDDSLLVTANYEYKLNDETPKMNVHFIKTVLLKLLSYFMYFFDYLL